MALITLAAVMSAGLSGCELFAPGEAKVTSPYTQQPATAAEIRAQADAAARDAARKAKDQADTMAANLRAEADAAKIEQARRKAAFDLAAASLDAETRSRLAALQAEYETASTETTLRIARMAADTERAVATLSASAAAKIDDAKASADAALAKIAEIEQRRESLISLATSAAGMVPGYGGLIAPLLAGFAGLAWGHKRGSNTAWDEATAAANAARDKADTLYDEGKRESETARLLGVLLTRTTPPASASESSAATG